MRGASAAEFRKIFDVRLTVRASLPAALAGAVVLLTAEPVRAAASFDCFEAKRPVELLICSDSELVRLDGALGEAYAARRQASAGDAERAALASEQRVWLQRRLDACGLPTSGGPLTPELRWRAAPCLAEIYRQRLAALGRPEPAPKIAATSAAACPLHPLCLESALGGPTSRDGAEEGAPPVDVPARACNDGNRHVAVDVAGDGTCSAAGATLGLPTWFGYRVFGRTTGGRDLASIGYSTGGTGMFTEIVEIQRRPANGDELVSARPLVPGGDRCFGGIVGAALIDGGIVEVETQATMVDFFASADPEFPDYDGHLPSCAACCFAIVRRHYPPAGDDRLISATIEWDWADALIHDDPVLACVDRRLRTVVSGFPVTLNAETLERLARDVRSHCPPQPRP
jgi:uncharacterized protein